jgi:exonuclease III
MENNKDILCVQEAEISENYNIEAYKIRGYELETELSLPNQTKRTSMYIRSGIKYKRRLELERPESHIIIITLEDSGIGIASVYRTYKLTHKPSHILALEEQISILTNLTTTHSRNIILGNFKFRISNYPKVRTLNFLARPSVRYANDLDCRNKISVLK